MIRAFTATAAMLVLGACAAATLRAVPEWVGGAIRVPGGTLFYESTGEGVPVVLIHGGFVDRRMWDDQIPKLARRFRVIRYDIRGFGRSSMPTEPFAAHADLAALLDSLHIQRTHLVGLSMGGGIALDFARVHPDRVVALVLAATGDPSYEYPAEDIQRVVALFDLAQENGPAAAAARWLEHPMLAATMQNAHSRERMNRLAADNAKFFALPFWPFRPIPPEAHAPLNRVSVPTLIAVGGRDTPANQAAAASLTRTIPRAEYVILEGAGHMVSMEEPERFTRLVLRFLSEHTPAR